MKEKLLLFFMAFVISISSFGQDATAIWNPSANPNTTYKWTEDANWGMTDKYPDDVEAANPVIGNNDFPATNECILDDSVNVFNIKIGDGGEEEAVLRIVKGGCLNTGKWWSGIGWTSPGRLIVERGGTMTFGEHFWNGWESEAIGIIEGTVNVTAMYGSAFTGQPGSGQLFVKNGGVLNLSQLHPDQSFPNGSFIDIAGGTLNFKTTAEEYEGDIEKLSAFIDDGSIISYDGNAELTVTYIESEGVIRVTAASVVYQVNLNEVTDKKENGKVWVMLGDGSDYEEMTDENDDGIYVASVTADRIVDLTYWFEYENASARTIEDMSGKECASGSKRAISGTPADSVLVLPAFLFNSCDEAEEAVQQETTVWTGASSNLWKVAENWSDGFVPAGNKVVFNDPNASECILNIESTVKQIVLGDGGEASTLKIAAGGTLNTTSGWSAIGYNAPASMLVEEGGTVNFAENAWIGWESDATLTIDGGEVNVAGMYGTAFEGGAGTGVVTIKRGALNLAQLDDTKSIPAGSKLDIYAGTVSIVGDKTDAVNGYITAGTLIAYGGQGTVNVSVVNDTTYLTGVPARQATTVWDPASNPESTGLWTEAPNWSDANIPLDNKVVFNVPDAMECVLNDTATIKTIVMGDNGPGGVLRVTNGGTLTTTQGWSGIAWTHDATLIVETGAVVNFAEHAWIGWEADATLQINGGTVNIAGMYGTAFEGGAGKAFVTVNDGELNLTGFDPVKSIPDSSFLNIKLGTVTIQGDQTEAVNAYAEEGRIMAYSGNGTLNVVFADGVTTITATAVRGGTTVWNPEANPSSTGLWSEALNWTDGLVPDSNKVVTNIPGARELVLNTEAIIKQFVFGDGGDGGVIRIADGGTLTTTQSWSGIGWSDTATLIVETGGTVNFAEHAWIGWTGNGTLIINGGVVNIAGMFGTAFEGQAGTGTTNVKKGKLNLTEFDAAKSIPDGSVMNLELGVVTIEGDKTEAVNAYANAGKITAFGGTGTLEVTFADGVTTIIAIPQVSATTVWDPASNPGTSTGSWSDAMNWSDRHVPADNKVVFKVTGAMECSLSDTSVIKQLVLGDGGDSEQVLRIANGGMLSTTNGWSGIGWNTPATLVVDSGGVFNFGSHAWIGWAGDGVIEINGGIVNIAGMYGTAFEGNPGGTGSVYVKSGEFNLTGFDPAKSIPEGSILDIEKGIVTIPGNHVAEAKAYIDLGRITGYGGNGQVFVHYDNDVTWLDARDWPVSSQIIEEELASKIYPNPTSGLIHIENPTNGSFSVNVYAITGKVVFTKNDIKERVFDLNMSATMKQGIYLIQVKSIESNTTHKVILK